MKKLAGPALLALIMVGCGAGNSPSPNTTPVASTATSVTIVPTTAPEVEQFAFVRAIDESEVRYDPAMLLTGEEAVEAAQADGVLAEGETLPNDFYISNPDQEEIVAALDPEGAYYLIGFDSAGALVDQQLSLKELVAVLNGINAEGFYGIIPGDVPMTLTIDGETAVAAHQQYLP